MVATDEQRAVLHARGREAGRANIVAGDVVELAKEFLASRYATVGREAPKALKKGRGSRTRVVGR